MLGADIEAKPDGSMYQMTHHPQAGYWVAYSRAPGDAPMVLITMQKLPWSARRGVRIVRHTSSSCVWREGSRPTRK